MEKVIVICNQKGGVGKTTTAVNTAAALAGCGHKILLIDIDPQGNAGSGLGVGRGQHPRNVYHVLMGECEIRDAVYPTAVEGLHICPSSPDLVGAELELVSVFGREMKLKQALARQGRRYDYILIDCPPSLNLLTVNAMTAGNSMLIPVQCEYYALEGISQLMQTVELVRANLNEDLKLLGVLLTMFDPRNNLSRQVKGEVENYFSSLVFTTVIPRNVKLSESPSHGVPIQLYASQSKGAESYGKLAEEILGRFEPTQIPQAAIAS